MEQEHDLIRQIVQGENELFEQIVLKYQDLIFTVCLNIVKNNSDAENMAQEAFLTAYCSLSSYQGGSLKSWLCRIAVNKSVDFIRKQSRVILEDIDDHVIQDDNRIEDLFEQKDRKERLTVILSAIPDKYSSVIKAFYFNRLPVKEIAAQRNVPEKTVETQLYRAKKLIKERWGEDD